LSAAVWVVIGKDRFLKQEWVRQLREKTLGLSAEAALNFQEFSAADEFQTFLDFVQTVPFLGANRLAVFWAFDDCSGEERTGLVERIDSMPSSAVLVVVSEEGNTRKDAVLRALSEKGRLVACHTPSDREWGAWMQGRAQSAGKTLKSNVVMPLLEKTGKDSAGVARAIEQLATFVGKKSEIEAEDVKALLGRSLHEDVFGLIDHLLKKDATQALKGLANLFSSGTRAPEIIAVIAGQLDRMLRFRERLEAGEAAVDIANQLKIHPYYQRKFFDQAATTSTGELKENLGRLLECDEAIKSGRLREGPALERFVLGWAARHPLRTA